MTNFVISHSGRDVFCEISPCSWMYKDYGLQVKLSVVKNGCNAESVFAHDKSIKITDKTPRDEMIESSKKVALNKLNEVGIEDLVAQAQKWAVAKADWDIQWAKDEEARQKREAKEIAKYKAKGFTHKFTGWIHPAKGDDRMVGAYCVGVPSDAEIIKLLRGCELKTDFKITEI